MVSGINNIEKSVFYPQYSVSKTSGGSSLLDFDLEDSAIISSEAKLLNELNKYNAGESDELNLALARVNAKNTVSAEVNVIQAKKDMFDEILDLAD